MGRLNGALSEDYYALRYESPLSTAVFHGSPLPLIFGAFRNDFSLGNFSLSINIRYKFKYFFRRNTINYYNLFSQGEGHKDYAKRWQQSGDELQTDVPSLVYPANANRDSFYTLSEATVERGDHIRLQDIRLQYAFENLGSLRDVQFYAYINNINLLLWKANKRGIDPDFVNGLKTPTSVAFGCTFNF